MYALYTYSNMGTITLVVIAVIALFVSVTLLGINRKGSNRDSLIAHMLDYYPHDIEYVGTDERILYWKVGDRLLAVRYCTNLMKDITYRYTDTALVVKSTGKIRSFKDFDKLILRVKSDA